MAPKPNRRHRTEAEPGLSTPTLLFISHSHRDQTLAKLLIRLLEAAIGITGNQIVCTSQLDCDHPSKPGDLLAETLCESAIGARAFLLLMTPSATASQMVMFETGARWALKKKLIPVLGPATPESLIPVPFRNKHIVSTTNVAGMMQLVRGLASDLGMQLQAENQWKPQLSRLCGFRPAEVLPGAQVVPHLAAKPVRGARLSSQLNRLLASRDPIDILEYFEDLWSNGQDGSIAFIRDKLTAINNPDSPFNRVYAIDHFDPSIWAAPQAYYWFALQARRFVKQNYFPNAHRLSVGGKPAPLTAEGESLASQPHAGQWNIQFSKEVLDAIHRSLANIAGLRGTDTPAGKYGHSVTPFDDLNSETEPVHSAVAGTPRFEIARILIWEARFFERDRFARHVLGMHGAFNIPLFYVPPGWIRCQRIDLKSEYMIFAKPAQDRGTLAHYLDGTVWPAGRNPTPTPVSQSTLKPPIDHFFRLLECPALLFAADAAKLVQEGRPLWNDYLRKHGIPDDD